MEKTFSKLEAVVHRNYKAKMDNALSKPKAVQAQAITKRVHGRKRALSRARIDLNSRSARSDATSRRPRGDKSPPFGEYLGERGATPRIRPPGDSPNDTIA